MTLSYLITKPKRSNKLLPGFRAVSNPIAPELCDWPHEHETIRPKGFSLDRLILTGGIDLEDFTLSIVALSACNSSHAR